MLSSPELGVPISNIYTRSKNVARQNVVTSKKVRSSMSVSKTPLTCKSTRALRELDVPDIPCSKRQNASEIGALSELADSSFVLDDGPLGVAFWW